MCQAAKPTMLDVEVVTVDSLLVSPVEFVGVAEGAESRVLSTTLR